MTPELRDSGLPEVGTSPELVVADSVKVQYRVRSRHFGTDSARIRAVDGVSLAIRRGETLGLVGESGSGKSTLGRALIRLEPLTDGAVRFGGRDLTRLSQRQLRPYRRRMQMIFQNPYSSLDPRMKIGTAIGEPLSIHRLASGKMRTERVAELLSLVGLRPEASGRYPHEFSGGQRQRIGIARALAAGPEFIVCDEPISSLDVSIQAQVINLLVDLQERLKLTYLLIAHDLSVVRHVADTVAVMYLGRIVETGSVAAAFGAPAHPYTHALLSAVPIPHPRTERKRRRIVLSGDLPSPASPPSGCRFHTRCWLYEHLGRPERCRVEDPVLRPVTVDHSAACHYVEDARRVSSGPV